MLFISCKENTEKPKPLETKKIEKKKVKKKKKRIYIPETVDYSFNEFLMYFSADSTFQMERVRFPLKVQQMDIYEGELKNKTVFITDYWIKKFLPYDKNNGDYKQDIEIKENEAIISIKGIENGLAVFYEFKKIDDQWFLVTWRDYST